MRITPIFIVLVLVFAFIPFSNHPAYAAIITIDGDCRLVDAIRSANEDRAYGGCEAGSGDDTLVLAR
ncbi:MAG: hypothetical protein HY862_18060, partial [Chloroflexi bacterium]|nr:hypothetical protein [Chloroflexota bacterium]